MNYERKVYESLNEAYMNVLNAKRQMQTLSQEIRTQFTGIGNIECAESLNYLIKHYEVVLKKIDKMRSQYEQNRF